MATQLGKLLRIVRINTGDSMRNMADKLDLSVSYLSAIENGKRNVPTNMEEKLFRAYELSEKDKQNVRDAIKETTSNIKVNITELSEMKKKLIFALTKDDLDNETIEELCAVLEKKEIEK